VELFVEARFAKGGPGLEHFRTRRGISSCRKAVKRAQTSGLASMEKRVAGASFCGRIQTIKFLGLSNKIHST
jgi:hypothetical protein